MTEVRAVFGIDRRLGLARGNLFQFPREGTPMLTEILSKAATVAMLCFVISSMLAMGAGLTVTGIIEPLRNALLVGLALLANFVLMPLGAFLLGKVLGLEEPFAVGLLLLGCAAGAPFLPKLAELAKGD